MGIYDRQYAREDEPGLRLSAPQSVTMRLVVITCIAYFVQLVAPAVDQWCALQPDWFKRPWLAYQLVTYGFMHDSGSQVRDADITHLLVNMFVLWMFGREVEQRYGPRQFLGFYLSAIVFAGAGWSFLQSLSGDPRPLVGASGGVAGVVALFALNFPHRQVMFMLVFPMPMWIAALIGVAVDIRAAMNVAGRVAGSAHLAGGLFGLCYYFYGVNPALWIWDRFSSAKTKRRPRLRVHAPDEGETADEMSEAVDEILRKIQVQGQDSLTRRERKLLEQASRKYQRRR